MKKHIKIVFILFFLFLFTEIYAQEYHWMTYVNSDNSTWIDWTEYKIYSEEDVLINEFIDKDIAIKRTRINLLDKIYNTILQLDLGNSKVKDIMNKKTKIELWDYLNESETFSIIRINDEIYKIIVDCSVKGPFLKMLLSQSYLLKQPTPKKATPSSMDFLKSYTGVVIEVGTDKFFPFFYVFIYNSDGSLLVSPTILDYDNFVQKGMALYLREENNILIKKRAGENPLFLKADSIYQNILNSLKLTKESSFYLNFKKVVDLIKQGKLVVVKKKYSIIGKESINEFEVSE